MADVILSKFGDHGSESTRRDKFQSHYAAFLCICMMYDPSITEILCEYGDDVVVNRSGVYELHQVKTRQESVSDWKMTDLHSVMAKSFALSPYFGSVAKCCFVSNEGATGALLDLKMLLQDGPGQWDDVRQKEFQKICDINCPKILGEMRRVDHDCSQSIDDVKARLIAYEIKTDFHHMDHIVDTNLRLIRQLAEAPDGAKHKATYTHEELVLVYEGIMARVDRANLGKTRNEKSIDRTAIEACLKLPAYRKTLYRFPTIDEISSAPGTTLLERKMNLGGFTSQYIEAARDLMVSALFNARNWQFGEAEEVLEDIRFRLRYVCADSFDQIAMAHPDKTAVGREILDTIKAELPKVVQIYNAYFVDELFLIGTIWELTSHCKAHWSHHLPTS